jgi:alkylhydroperoxidase/carboxymuconolactone decarboxylase family protein YurZ
LEFEWTAGQQWCVIGGREVIHVAEYPLKVFESVDPGLVKLVEDTGEFALADGALPRRFKLLIAMALDAAHGAVGGVEALARMALQAGATKEEIAEALRVAQYVSGVGSVYTAAHALREVL